MAKCDIREMEIAGIAKANLYLQPRHAAAQEAANKACKEERKLWDQMTSNWAALRERIGKGETVEYGDICVRRNIYGNITIKMFTTLDHKGLTDG